MSYTKVNGMRSARYPLQGLGSCTCNSMGSGDGLGALSTTQTMTAVTVGAVVLGLGTLGAFMMFRRRR